MILSIDSEKTTVQKINHPFTIRSHSKQGIKYNFFNLLKDICKTTGNMLNGESLNTLPLRSGTRQGYPLSSVLINIVLEVLAKAIQQEKEIKCIQILPQDKWRSNDSLSSEPLP